jgi:putative FmdB family regulatory protein
MPIYATKCQSCGRDDAVYRSVAERDKDIPACECGGAVQRVVSAPYVAADMSPYRSMITGEMITSRSQHRAHLKAHNCIEIGNETKYLKPKEKIDLAPESKKARKQKIIEQVNQLKG